jgi:hypothetical protein
VRGGVTAARGRKAVDQERNFAALFALVFHSQGWPRAKKARERKRPERAGGLVGGAKL